jgi:hypothetical protein
LLRRRKTSRDLFARTKRAIPPAEHDARVPRWLAFAYTRSCGEGQMPAPRDSEAAMVAVYGDITARDDYTHPLGPEPNFNDSMYFNFFDNAKNTGFLRSATAPTRLRRGHAYPLPARRHRPLQLQAARDQNNDAWTPAACASG